MRKLKELPVLEPRHHCENYMCKNGIEKSILLTKEEFDGHAKSKDFEDGPYKDSFGDGYGEPYNPHRQAFGRLKDGRAVYCELSRDLAERVRGYLKENKSGGKNATG